jgi:hypothetical protein
LSPSLPEYALLGSIQRQVILLSCGGRERMFPLAEIILAFIELNDILKTCGDLSLNLLELATLVQGQGCRLTFER